MKRTGRAVFATGLVMCLVAAASGQTSYTWNGGTGAWMTDSNWSPSSPSPDYSTVTGDDFTVGSGTAQASSGLFGAMLEINGTGTLDVTTDTVDTTDLILDGGTIGSNQTINTRLRTGTLSIDNTAAGTIDNSGSGLFTIQLILNAGSGGSGDVDKTGSGQLILNSSTAGTWAGTMTISGGSVRLNNANALASGTITVDGDEFESGLGFNFGRVDVLTGGIVTSNYASNNRINEMHLDGGTIKATVNGARMGDNNVASDLWIDAGGGTLSTGALTNNQRLEIRTQLNGTGDITIDTPVAGAYVEFEFSGVDAATYSGTIHVDSGDLVRMGHDRGLCGGDVDVTTGGTFQTGVGFLNGTVTVNTGGVMQVTSTTAEPLKEVRLDGGTIEATVNGAQAGNNSATNAQVFVDSDSVLRTGSALNSGHRMRFRSELNGSADLNIEHANAGARIDMEYGGSATVTYSGTIHVDSGDILRMAHDRGLSGGNVDVTTGGTFQIGTGFINGQVDINTGATAEANTSNPEPLKNLHLKGGTLEATVNAGTAGDNSSSNAKIYVDTDSVLRTGSALVSGHRMRMRSQLNGSADLTIEHANAGARIDMDYSGSTATTYSGTIHVDSGDIVRMVQDRALSGGTVDVTTGGTFQLGSGFINGQVNINSGATAEATVTAAEPLKNLHLNGGTLEAALNNGTAGDSSGSNANIYVDSASTLGTSSAVSSGNALRVRARLNGSGDLDISNANSGARVDLEYGTLSTTYTGTITVDTGDTLRMRNANGLCGGTVEVDSGGTLSLYLGAANGTINVNAGGTALADHTTDGLVADLHLNGGLLEGTANTTRVGNNSASSNVYVDADSEIKQDSATNHWLYIRSVLNGTGKLTKTGQGQVRMYRDNASTYTGDWDIQAGLVEVRNIASSWTAEESLGSGSNVALAGGAFLDFVDSSTNTWTMTKTVTGNGTVSLYLEDNLVIARDGTNSFGGISPGNSAGILVFDIHTNDAFGTNRGELDFATNGGGDAVEWYIEVVGTGGVAGTDFDQIQMITSNPTYPYSYLDGLGNVDLIVDLTALSGSAGNVTIFTGADNDLSSMAFNSVTTVGTGTYGVSYSPGGEIILTDVFGGVIPEPATLTLLAFGAMGMLVRRRRRVG